LETGIGFLALLKAVVRELFYDRGGKTKGRNAKYGSSGNILGQGGKTQGTRVWLHRETRFFAEIGLLYAVTTTDLHNHFDASINKNMLF